MKINNKVSNWRGFKELEMLNQFKDLIWQSQILEHKFKRLKTFSRPVVNFQ